MRYTVKELREKAGLTQEELAKKAGVSRAIVSGLESGAITVTTTKTLVKIAEALSVKVSELFLKQMSNM